MRDNTTKTLRATVFFVLLVLLSSVVMGQSWNKNYIKTTTAQKPLKGNIGYQNKDNVNIDIVYFDGLGRQIQSVSREATPLGKDLVIEQTYDAYGRADKTYLPRAYTNNYGRYVSNVSNYIHYEYAYTHGFGWSDAGKAYSQTQYEASPLNRVTKSLAPGGDWVGADRGVAYGYGANLFSDQIFAFEVSVDGMVSTINGKYFPDGRLYKNTTTDENGNKTLEYKNLSGQVVCKQSYVSDSNYVSTYYLYDDFAQLRYVVQPEGVQEMGSDASMLNNASFRDKWVFQYEYDERNRMIAKKVPGAGWVYMVYDRRDRLVLSQDAEQRENNKWAFTKYDALNRPVLTAIKTIDRTRQYLQNQINTLASNNNYIYAMSYVGNTSSDMYGYNNAGYPSATASEILSVTYYDNHDFLSLPEFTDAYNYTGTSAHNSKLKGLTTGGLTRILDKDDMLPSVTYYDSRYRPIQSIVGNHLNGTDKVTTTYENVVSANVKEVTREHSTDYNSDKTITESFTYDHRDRLLSSTTAIDGKTSRIKHSYNELGQLTSKNLGGVQLVDYAYNIRGWLTKINGGTDPVGTTDKFGMLLKYNDANTGYKQYNGNIGEMLWNTGSSVYNSQSYKFKYDGLNRLTKADYGAYQKAAYCSVDNLDYDANGNILSLSRYQGVNNGKRLIDDLSYSYADGNQLSAVADNGNATTFTDPTGSSIRYKDLGFKDGNTTSTDYLYDRNGNMVTDRNKSISTISYNHLNLPSQVTLGTNKSVSYLYDAMGTKLSKTFTDGSHTETTDYIGGMHYKDETLDFVQHAEGRYMFGTAKFQYDLKDHLGNVRVTVESEKEQPEPTTIRYALSPYESPRFPTNSSSDFQIKASTYALRVKGSGGASSEPAIVNVSKGQEISVSVMAYAAYNHAKVSILFKDASTNSQRTLENFTKSLPTARWATMTSSTLTAPADGTIEIRLIKPSSYSDVYYDELTIKVQGELLAAEDITVVQSDDYYPFGGTFNSVTTSGDENLYKYNGKEEQKELSTFDYGWRQFDPWIGRFNVVDAYADKYYDMSPYSYAANNPILNIDVNGDSVWVTSNAITDVDGNTTINHTVHISGKVLKQGSGSLKAGDLTKGLNERLSSQNSSTTTTDDFGRTTTTNVSISGEFSTATSMDDVAESDHLVVIVDNVEGKGDPSLGVGNADGLASRPGQVSFVESKGGVETAFHEVGHNLGLPHPSSNSSTDPMSYTGRGSNFSPSQMTTILNNSIRGTPNNGNNSAIMGDRYPGVSEGSYNPSSNSRPFSIAPNKRDRIPLPLINKTR